MAIGIVNCCVQNENDPGALAVYVVMCVGKRLGVIAILVAIGIVRSCLHNEKNHLVCAFPANSSTRINTNTTLAAFALICDYVTNADQGVRAGAVLGLGLAYAGTRREEVAELLVPLVLDTDVPMEVGDC